MGQILVATQTDKYDEMMFVVITMMLLLISIQLICFSFSPANWDTEISCHL